MKDLINILTWCRGAGTKSEAEFVRRNIATIPNIWADEYGNYHLTIGENPKILWSCHTDTVTRKEGMQNVKWVAKGILGLNNGQHGQCLGADDGAGLWIMLELIKAEKPGHYVFHRNEEIGGLGSNYIAKNNYLLPVTLKAAIAMDRCGRSDIITHQGYQRTASDVFADSLGRQLPLGMVRDDTGVFTDTANYIDIIGECTNLACGYECNHGKDETLDTFHVRRLRDALVKLDIDQLVFSREAGEVEYADYYGGYAGHGMGHMTVYTPKHEDSRYEDDDDDYTNGVWNNYGREGVSVDGSPLDSRLEGVTLEDMVSEAPAVAARLIKELGVSDDEFRAHVFAITGRLLGN